MAEPSVHSPANRASNSPVFVNGVFGVIGCRGIDSWAPSACTATHARRPLLFVLRVGGYVDASKGQTLVIHKAPEDKAPQDKAETAADGKAESESESDSGTKTPVAFFQ